MLSISELYIYPVKSLGGVALKEAEVTDRGLKHDRRWMLVDAAGQFVSQRTHAAMALFKLAAVPDGFKVTYQPDGSSFLIGSEMRSNITIPVTIWDDTCTGTLVAADADAWFTVKLNFPVRLIYMADESLRPVDGRYARTGEVVSFADAYPILLLGQASIDNLNQKLADWVGADRFRPNIVFTGGDAHCEDCFAHLTINNIDFYGVKPCARCVMIGINQQDGSKNKEPAKTLASYRTRNKKIYFGQNLLYRGTGIIRVNDSIAVQRQRPDFMEQPDDLPLYEQLNLG